MQKYVFAYRGKVNIETKQEGAALMVAWKAWMQGLGDAVIDPGMPVGPSKTVSADGVVDGGGPDPLAGITIVQADSFDAALEMAKACPHVELGGTMEVAPALDMEM